MADSRRASIRKIKNVNDLRRVLTYQTQVIYFLLSLLVAILCTYWLRSPDFTPAQDYVLFLLFFSVGLWVTEAIPPFAVGILIVGYLVFFLGSVSQGTTTGGAELNVQKFVSTWSNSVIWLILGGFFLAEGMRKTGVDRDVFRFTLTKLGPTPACILLSVMLSTALASMLMSNTATTAMMLAATAPIVTKYGATHPFGKAVLLSIPIAASIGGMGTIIGSPPNAIAAEALNTAKALPFQVGFLEWLMVGFPVALVLTLILWKLLLRKFPIGDLQIDLADMTASPEQPATTIFDEIEHRIHKQIVLITLLTTLLLWLTGRWHGIPPAAVSGIPIIVFTMVSIITGEDVRQLPWDTLMLVAGGLSLGLAIQDTQLSNYFVIQIQHLHIPNGLIVGVFALTTVVFSNIMSNTATATILIPVAALWPELPPAILPLVIGLSASCALFLPVSTPPNAIVFSTGLVKQEDFRFGGWIVGLLGPALVIAWVMLLMQIWGN
ncbi:MAG: DASS family sodium-coupled anion symporter [Bacteroidetes bacterium]|nr:MAG: DASS family sodium-coupled anion symporter [Bacteroidota bacterium]